MTAEAYDSAAEARSIADQAARRYGVLEVVDGAATLTNGYPSEIWWRSADSCIECTRARWLAQAEAAGLHWVGIPAVTVRLDEQHLYRMRYVQVSAVLVDAPWVAPGFELAYA
jgi:hypothetical protein